MTTANRRLTPRAAFEAAPFEAAIALAAFISAIVYWSQPDAAAASAIGQTAATLTPYWEVLYGVGGLLVILGLLQSLRVEAAGLSLFIAAVAIQSITIVDFRGLTGVASAMTFAAIALAGIIRIHVLYKAWSASTAGR